MTNSINIDSLKARVYEIFKKDDGFYKFLTEDISKSYQCITDMLKNEMDSIEIILTKDNITKIERLMNRELAVNPGSIKVGNLKTAIGRSLWEDNRTLWGDKSKDFFGEANKEVRRFNDIWEILFKRDKNTGKIGKKDILIFTNPNSVKDADIIESISEFFDSIKNNEELTKVFDGLNTIIHEKGEVNSDSINIKLIHLEQVVRHIALYFINAALLKNPSFLKDKIKVEGAYYNTEKLQKLSNECNFSVVINNIIKYLTKQNKICDFLNILRIQRNILAHITSNVTKPADRIVFSRFVLYTLIGTFYVCRRFLTLSGAYEDIKCKEKIFSVYFNRNLNDDIISLPENDKKSIISSLSSIKLYRNTEVNPKNIYNSHIEYTIVKDEKYKLEFGEGESKVSVDVPTEDFWLSPSNKPIAIWTGVKTYFFTDISTIYSELDPYIQNANKEEIDALNSLVKTLNHLVIDLSNKTEENSYVIKLLVEASNSIDKRLKTLIDIVDGTSKDVKSILSAVKVLIGILCGFLVIAFGLYIFYELSANPNPESFIEKGDTYLKNHKPEKAGDAYRKAIAGYEAILKTDSNNIKANIGLATMLMRGKGKYDIEYAKQCAKRASIDKRGQGLYAYLLALSGNDEEANKCLKSIHNLDDEYAKLADALLTIYGLGREQTEETIQQANSIISNLSIQEAPLEIARMAQTGVPDNNKEGSFYIYPDPMLGINYLGILAQDSLNLTAMVLMSEFYSTMGNINAAFNIGYAALVSGMETIAPSLIIQTLNDIDIEKSDDYYAQRLEKISRIAEQNNSVLVNLSRFCHGIYNYSHKRNGITAKQLVKDIDGIINEIETSDNEELTKILDDLYKLRVSLCLQCGNLSRATQLAMKIDDFNDSIAVNNYLLGICFAKGYGDIPIDTIESKRFINEAANSGYEKAIYTRLRMATPLDYKVEEVKNLIVSNSRWLKYTYDIEIYDSVLKKQIGFLDLTDGEPSGQRIMSVDSDGTIKCFLFYYTASKYADLKDSIWENSPLIAMEMADYWRDYYRPRPATFALFEEEIPYLQYCPKEYQIMYNTIITCYEYRTFDNHDGFTNQLLPRTILEEQMLQLQIGIASALEHRNGEFARHLITMWLTLAEDYGMDENNLTIYKEFALPEYINDKNYAPYKKMDYPKYSY